MRSSTSLGPGLGVGVGLRLGLGLVLVLGLGLEFGVGLGLGLDDEVVHLVYDEHATAQLEAAVKHAPQEHLAYALLQAVAHLR